MLMRRRIDKLERSFPPTVPNLVSRIEREAMNALSPDQQRIVNGYAHDNQQSAEKCYQEALSSTLKQVSDDDLDRIIVFYQANNNRATLLR